MCAFLRRGRRVELQSIQLLSHFLRPSAVDQFVKVQRSAAVRTLRPLFSQPSLQEQSFYFFQLPVTPANFKCWVQGTGGGCHPHQKFWRSNIFNCQWPASKFQMLPSTSQIANFFRCQWPWVTQHLVGVEGGSQGHSSLIPEEKAPEQYTDSVQIPFDLCLVAHDQGEENCTTTIQRIVSKSPTIHVHPTHTDASEATQLGAMWTQSSITKFFHAYEAPEHFRQTLQTEWITWNQITYTESCFLLVYVYECSVFLCIANEVLNKTRVNTRFWSNASTLHWKIPVG